MIEIPLIRSSERKAFKTCQYQWHWAWNEGLVPAMPKASATWFGGIIHIALAEYYTPPGGKDGFTRGRPLLESWEELSRDAYTTVAGAPYFDDEKEREYYDAVELGRVMLTEYEKYWGDDGHWEVLMPESRFRANIPYTKDQLKRFLIGDASPISGIFPEGKYITTAVGTFDMPVRDHSNGGRIKVVDHKTTNKREDPKHLEKDDQIGTYMGTGTVALRNAGLIKNDEAIDGMVFNYLRKAKPPDNADENGVIRNKPKKEHYIEAINKATGVESVTSKDSLPTLVGMAEAMKLVVWGEPSKNQGVPLFWRNEIFRNKHNRLRQVERIAEDAEMMARLRAGELPLLKSPGEHCNWCIFTDLCDINESGGDEEQFKKDVFRVQDMYADHREFAINSKSSVKNKQETGLR